MNASERSQPYNPQAVKSAEAAVESAYDNGGQNGTQTPTTGETDPFAQLGPGPGDDPVAYRKPMSEKTPPPIGGEPETPDLTPAQAEARAKLGQRATFGPDRPHLEVSEHQK